MIFEFKVKCPLLVTTTITDVRGAAPRDPIGATAVEARGTATTAVVEATPATAADPGRVPLAIRNWQHQRLGMPEAYVS